MSLRAITLAALLCLSFQTSKAQAADEPLTKSDSPAQGADAARYRADVQQQALPNFHEVHPYLFRSGAPDELGLKEAKDKGVDTVIDLRNPGEIKQKGDEELWAKRLGLRYINMPMGPQAPSKQTVYRFCKLVDQAKANKKAVLVHCAHGSDRTGCLIGVWRVSRDGWTYDKAYDEMRHDWFSPKFTQLSGTVKKYSQASNKQ